MSFMNLTKFERWRHPNLRHSLWELSKNFMKHHWRQLLVHQNFPPRAMCLYVTYRCNMRCRICGIWTQAAKYKESELSLEQFRSLLSDPLFSELEFININGGEPNLREDLVQLTEMLINLFPRLKTVTLNSNGLPAKKMVDNVQKMSVLCQKKDIRFSVAISLHALGKEYDEIAGIPHAYFLVKEGLDSLKELRLKKGFYLSTNCVITDLTVHSLDKMLDWSDEEQIHVNFTLGEVRERFYNLGMARAVQIQNQDRADLVRFLRRLSQQKGKFFQHALRYAHLADMIEFKKKRTLACHYALAGVILGSDGLLYYCKNSKAIGDGKEKQPLKIYFDPLNLAYRRESLFWKKCDECPPNTYNIIEVEKDLLKIAKFWLLA